MSALFPPNFGSVLLDLYRFARTESISQFSTQALQQLQTVLPFDAAAIYHGEFRDRVFHLHAASMYQQGSELAADYVGIAAHDPLLPAAIQAPGSVLSSQHCTPEWSGVSELKFYYAKHGIAAHHCLALKPFAAGDSELPIWSIINLYHFEASNDELSDRIKLFGLLGAHFAESYFSNHVWALHTAQIRSEHGFALFCPDDLGYRLVSSRKFALAIATEFGTEAAAKLKRYRLPTVLLAAIQQRESRYVGEHFVFDFTPHNGYQTLIPRPRHPLDKLTPTERRIALQIANGLSHKEIAQLLGRTPSTIRSHQTNIRLKLNAKNNSEVAGMVGRGGS